jgi:hypothetical protein
MRNPIRRSRNIGTAKQGIGQNNRLDIPYMFSKLFYENLSSYEKIEKTINGHTFTFITEETRASTIHACSIRDLETMIGYIPSSDYGDLKLIILRQPTRKQERISPVWGRLIFYYTFENREYPAIILEAANYEKPVRWKRGLDPDDQKELERLRNDGHQFTEDKRGYTCHLQVENVRNTQLYRTLLHEFGHYVQYYNAENFFGISKNERERFAHNYAEKLNEQLRKEHRIPFDKIN